MDVRKNILANFKQYVDNKKKEEYENKLIIEEKTEKVGRAETALRQLVPASWQILLIIAAIRSG